MNKKLKFSLHNFIPIEPRGDIKLHYYNKMDIYIYIWCKNIIFKLISLKIKIHYIMNIK